MKTIKQWVVLAILVLTSTAAFSQAGIRVGVNLANQNYKVLDESLETNTIVGLNAALVYNIAVSDLFSVQPELHFIQKGSQLEIPILGDFKTTLNYLELAVAAKFNIVNFGEANKVYAAVTPSAGYLMSGTSKFGDESEPIEFDDDSNRMDFGIGLGAGVQFGGFFVDIRYNIGFANLSNLEDESVKNNGILIGLGYMF